MKKKIDGRKRISWISGENLKKEERKGMESEKKKNVED